MKIFVDDLCAKFYAQAVPKRGQGKKTTKACCYSLGTAISVLLLHLVCELEVCAEEAELAGGGDKDLGSLTPPHLDNSCKAARFQNAASANPMP